MVKKSPDRTELREQSTRRNGLKQASSADKSVFFHALTPVGYNSRARLSYHLLGKFRHCCRLEQSKRIENRTGRILCAFLAWLSTEERTGSRLMLQPDFVVPLVGCLQTGAATS
jgi:hypothetical protein